MVILQRYRFQTSECYAQKNHNDAYRIIVSVLGRPFGIPYKGQKNTYFFWRYLLEVNEGEETNPINVTARCWCC
ncbi:hypothetical protein VCR15J2_470833 [Vibrio coralliirubri]|uniref:Uncharacterized protein n=1 Tax=Vibrio coralliirubri TaxID=1516159 RepID=A0AA87BYZ7_9VIBR|nr:hypothetical protein VCR31J2_1270824 [Vibrio coralliirubri]CDT70973.1 hypothetical protein VCR15J2_470833 [Vibrio coralliirubri]